MDPNATLWLILDGIRELNRADTSMVGAYREQTVAALRDLATWLAKGGFPPRPVQMAPNK